MVWVSSCSHANILNAIGGHRAIMIGYAKDTASTIKNTQKFNCHKIGEFEVGVPLPSGALGNKNLSDLIKVLASKDVPSAQHVMKRVNLYADMLQDQRENGEDLLYWIDYVYTFNVGHKIPDFDHMHWSTYYNADIWLIVASFCFLTFLISKSIAYYLHGKVFSQTTDAKAKVE
jgi:hypothetical protein